MLKDIYQLTVMPEGLDVNVEFAKPEMIKTEMEMLEVAQKEIEMGLTSRVHVLMKLKGMSKEDAINYLKEVDQFSGVA